MKDTQPSAPEAPATNRRDLIKKGGALAGAALFSTLGHHGVWAAGSDAPEKKEVKIGFIPLTDCASVVMASVLGIDQKYGVKIIPTKEASWPGVRDKLSTANWTLPMCCMACCTACRWASAARRRTWRC